ncbi:ketopantoate reductase PanE/ApbA C terminal-domain-containing protein, partial [Dipodascopsis uninucleata]
IVVLGAGSIGCFVASSLRRMRNAPLITLVMRTKESSDVMKNVAKNTILIEEPSEDNSKGTRLVAANNISSCTIEEAKQSSIKYLIVCTKSHQTISAISLLKDQINRKSTIVLLQNGMGLVQQLLKEVWKNSDDRPNIIYGINSHGCTRLKRPMAISHRGRGTIKLAVVPRKVLSSEETVTEDDLNIINKSSRKLLTTLVQCEPLRASVITFGDFTIKQIYKFAVNCCINPLTAIFNCPNGSIASYHELKSISGDVIRELVRVLQADPDMQRLYPDGELNDIFNYKAFMDEMINIARLTASNVSSMRSDVLHNRPTEIDYLNGYISRKGSELQIATPVNDMLVKMIKAKYYSHAGSKTSKSTNSTNSKDFNATSN